MSQLSSALTQWTMASGAALIVLFAPGGHASPDELPKVGTSFTDCAGCPEMVVVPAGSFTMGSPTEEDGHHDDEEPAHRVTIAKPLAISRFEITRGQFLAFVEATGRETGNSCYVWRGEDLKNVKGKSFRDPGYQQTDDHPVACVSWTDVQAYAQWLSEKTHQNYRLLSEAEWEYAARAGTATAFATGDTLTEKQANFNTSGTVKVGSYPANAFGLHDMHGNLWEWVQDCYVDSYKDSPIDGFPRKDSSGCKRVNRGGGWIDYPKFMRSASRKWDSPTDWFSVLGFRLARTI
jgi:formylglycine-generating enzyme required for sulfatase activity